MQRSAFTILMAALVLPALGAKDPTGPVSFRDEVAPILVRKCLGCHNTQKAVNGLNMATFALLKKGGKSAGDLILEPGDPDASGLIESVRPDASPRMPYKLPPLEAREIRTLERWVKEGAKFDGPSETETPIASLVDPLRDLPKVALQVPAVDPVTSLTYSPDGKTLAAASGRQVTLFDVATGKPRATLADHPGPVNSVRITPDGATLVASGGRPGQFGSVVVWDLANAKRRLDLRGHRDAILAAAISPDGKLLATAGYDRLILLWDLALGQEVRPLKDHTDSVYAVAFSPDGRTLASAGADRTVKLWNVASGERTRTLSEATAELYAVVFAPDGQTVLAGGVDRSIRAWRVTEQEASLANSAFAHSAPILRLVATPDGKLLFSSGEDKAVKAWDLATLKPRTSLPVQPDWPQSLAASPDGSRLAVGRYDGSLSVYDPTTGAVALALRTAPEAAPAPKPELVRNATLDAPSPRGATRGRTVSLTLTGRGVGRSTAVVFNEPGLDATIVPAEKPDSNRLAVKLTIAEDARVGLHRIGVITPLGVPAFQTFAVSAAPELSETEPNDDPAGLKPITWPVTFEGTIAKPGDVDHARFEAKAGQTLVAEALARPIGSSLVGSLAWLDAEGRVLAESVPSGAGIDPVVSVTLPRDGVVTLRVSDVDYAGSGNSFYRIDVGERPVVESAFPLGVGRGETADIEVVGRNLGGVTRVAVPVAESAEPGSILEVPVVRSDGSRPSKPRTVVVADGPQGIESEPNDEFAQAGPVASPGGVSGHIGREGDVDCFRFEARKGRRLIVEVFGRRLGTAIDSVIEILDVQGQPVPRAVVRPVDQTEVAFRDHESTTTAIRLTRWNNLAIGDPVLIGREVIRVQALPRNPDDNCTFWGEQGERIGLFETTPEQHPMGQPIYKVELHPPGTTFPTGGVPPVTLNYRNDDGGPGFLKDSRLTFDPPADGSYLLRVEDVRGLGGDRFGYHLVIRDPRPDFRLTLSPESPNVPRGGSALVTATITKLDGFDDPVDVTVEDLPPGVTATAARVEEGMFTANLLIMADATAPAFSKPTWRASGRAVAPVDASPGEGEPMRHDVDPGGPSGGWVTVTPEPNLKITATPDRVVIRPGERVEMTLAVKRAPAFAGRVPIDVRNLPHGVRVLNIGLNGVLVTESQAERSIFLYAEPWVKPMERPFFAVGKAESAGTEDSSPPIGLVVRSRDSGPEAAASRAGPPPVPASGGPR